MGLTLFVAILHLCHVDLVVVAMCTDPLDPDNAFLKIRCNDQTIIVALNVENDAFCSHYAGVAILALDLRHARPAGAMSFLKPRIQRSLERPTVLVPRARG